MAYLSPPIFANRGRDWRFVPRISNNGFGIYINIKAIHVWVFINKYNAYIYELTRKISF